MVRQRPRMKRRMSIAMLLLGVSFVLLFSIVEREEVVVGGRSHKAVIK